MNPDLKARWLKELRSQKHYVKARRLLYRGIRNGKKRMCCLGVLCDLADVSTPDWRSLTVPSYRDATALGLHGHTNQLVRLNDTTKGWDKAIEYIEANL